MNLTRTAIFADDAGRKFPYTEKEKKVNADRLQYAILASPSCLKTTLDRQMFKIWGINEG